VVGLLDERACGLEASLLGDLVEAVLPAALLVDQGVLILSCHGPNVRRHVAPGGRRIIKRGPIDHADDIISSRAGGQVNTVSNAGAHGTCRISEDRRAMVHSDWLTKSLDNYYGTCPTRLAPRAMAIRCIIT
jgi:hypothetical protein